MLKVSLLLLTILSLNTYGSEEFPGGSGTTSDLSVQAFSHPVGGSRGSDRREFTVGNSFFQGVWVAAPASTTLRDGLGPVYNATSCAACHFKDGRGRGLPDEDGRTDVSLLFRLKIKKENGQTEDHPEYGGQFNPIGIMGVPGEGESHVQFEKIQGQFSDGESYELLRPKYSFLKLAYGKIGSETIASPRVGPQMIGLGLIENIKESDILKKVDPQDLNRDGIRGKANYVFSIVENKRVLGRFGWKASQPNLLEQNAAAFHGDIGITSYLHPKEDCTYVQLECKRDQSEDDISEDILNKVTSYTQLLAVPVRRSFDDLSVKRGQVIFNQVSCQSCHTPHYKTGNESRFSVLNNQDIYPYSDFLLHDMGDDLAEDKEVYQTEGLATTREWRTPPLWGIGMIKIVNGHTRLLHDGRARDVNEAILWHGGEAKGAQEEYKKLKKSDREDLVNFINSL